MPSEVVEPVALTYPRGAEKGECPKCHVKALVSYVTRAGTNFRCEACKSTMSAREYVGRRIGAWPDATNLTSYQIKMAMDSAGLTWNPDAPPPAVTRFTEKQIAEVLRLAVPWDRATQEDRDALKGMGIVRGDPSFFFFPRGTKTPEWFWFETAEGKKWDPVRLYQILFPMYDENGIPHGVKFRSMYPKEGQPKSRSTSGTHGLILADTRIVSALQDAAPWPRWVIIVEGEKDFAAAVTRWSDAHPDAGFIGICQGAISEKWLNKIPATSEIVSLVDPDAAGEAYHREIEKKGIHDGIGAIRRFYRIHTSLWAALHKIETYTISKPPDVADTIVNGWAPARLALDALLDDPNQAIDLDALLNATLNAYPEFIIDQPTGTLQYTDKPGAKEPRYSVVCQPVPSIESLATDVQTGETLVSIGWTAKGGARKSLLLSNGIIADPRALAKALRVNGLNVFAVHAGTLAQWFACQQQVGIKIIPSVVSARANGWYNIANTNDHARGAGFLLGKRWIGTGERVFYDDSTATAAAFRMVSALRPTDDGSFVEWCKGFKRIEAYPVPQIHILTCLASPMLARLDVGGVMIGNVYPPQTAKTLAMQIGLSTFARPDREDGAFQGWQVTNAGLEQALNCLRHLTLCLDDTSLIRTDGQPGQEAVSRAKRISEIVFFIANGAERLLGSTPSSNRGAGGWRIFGSFTAEERPDFKGQQEGTEKRFIGVTAHPWQRMPTKADPTPPVVQHTDPLPNEMLLDFWACAKKNAGHVMPEYLRTALRIPTNGLQKSWATWAATYREDLRGKVKFVDTLAEVAATLKIAQEIFEDTCKAQHVLSPLHPRIVEWFLHHIKTQFAQDGIDNHVVSHGRELIQWLLSLRMSGLFWVLSHERMKDPIVEPRRQGTAAHGVWETSTILEAGDLYVYSSVFDLFLQKHPSPRRRTDLIRGWIDAGIIEPGPGYVPGAPLRNAQISTHVPMTGSIRLYKIPRHHFED